MTLGGIARETSSIRLGTLVTSATFRHPSMLAIAVAQVDEMSGGRVELGLGAGWFQDEHDAYGIELPPMKERFDRFEEQLQIITGLWQTPTGETFSHNGSHYQLKEAPGLPKPVQQPVPIMIGGKGKKRTPELAARFAAEFNVPFESAESVEAQFQRVRAACQDAGRDPDELTYSAALVMYVGRDDAEVTRRAAAIGREKDELIANGVAGTVQQAREKLAAYEAVGVQRVYLQVLDLADPAHIELLAPVA